ncbi:MAG: hypothetical protein APF82_00845 [Sphingomonadales bacterium BRH_c42]|nr:MAG: hypothetical protein APF82_00845 [Sphingomonadales bacterium BRH_c42]
MNVAVSPTPRQMDVLRFIAGYLEASGGVAPKYRQIGEACGIAGMGQVSRMLGALEERGCIRRLPGRHQAIEVLASVSIPRGPAGEPLYFVPLGTSAGEAS